MRKKRILNLHLFDGEAGASAGEGVANPNAEGNETVIYGKATDDQNNPSPESQPEAEPGTIDKVSKFKELIKGEFKDEYKALIKEQLDRRLKNHKTELDPTQSAINEHLKSVYGTSDLSQLLSALESDNRLFQEKADQLGITAEEYKRNLKLDIREAQINQAEAQRQESEEAQAQYQKWYEEAEALKESYPNFDLETESENPDFTDLLIAGVPVQKAYEVVHLNDIMTGTAQMVADAVSKNTINNVRARGVRPAENGITEQPGVVRKSNVNDLTDKDLDDIIQRVNRGEKITW